VSGSENRSAVGPSSTIRTQIITASGPRRGRRPRGRAHEQRGRTGIGALPDVGREVEDLALTESPEPRFGSSRTRRLRGRGKRPAMGGCRWPPENSAAVSPTPTPGADCGQELGGPGPLLAPREPIRWMSGPVTICSTFIRGSRDVAGSWKTTPIFRRLGFQLPERQGEPVVAVEPGGPPVGLHRRRTIRTWWSSPTPTRPRRGGVRPPRRTNDTPLTAATRIPSSPSERSCGHEFLPEIRTRARVRSRLRPHIRRQDAGGAV